MSQNLTIGSDRKAERLGAQVSVGEYRSPSDGRLPFAEDAAARTALAKRPKPTIAKILEQASAVQRPLVVAYGGGTNSTAMLCGFRERGIRPALILFADTGGELPHTYEHLRVMSDKCQEWFGLPIETVVKTYKGEPTSLESDCLRNKTLPALAFASKACSMKYKIEPVQKRTRQWMDANGVKTATKAIGYDRNEGHRSMKIKGADLGGGCGEINWYPLLEWQWGRDECVTAIARHGLPQAGKSSCFFCPAMKLREIIRLRAENPEHFQRAISMEENMTVKGRVEGLAFGQKWSEIVKADDSQLKLFDWIDKHDAHAIPCGCYDG